MVNIYANSLDDSAGKESTCNAGDTGYAGSIPGKEKWKIFPWKMKWQPTPVFLPEKPHGQRSLMGYSPVSHKESDTTERLSTQKRKLLLDVSLPILSPSPARILLPGVTHSSRTRWSPVQKRRKVLALERQELGS